MVITEDYVSFNTAKLLKEKGFNEPCYTNYVENEISHYDYSSTNFELIDGIISAPTLQTAMKWLREVYNILIVVDRAITHYYWELEDNKTGDDIKGDGEANTFEEACEMAIRYCLENLI